MRITRFYKILGPPKSRAGGSGSARGAMRAVHVLLVASTAQRLFAPLDEVARHLCAALGCADALAELETAAAR